MEKNMAVKPIQYRTLNGQTGQIPCLNTNGFSVTQITQFVVSAAA